ncbi:MAG: ABC transporter ATP-binding protein [Chloroflexi bacterium]|nr:ABC transporter ATP-binding protein [Chloroflexota bacterium]MDA8189059.1 ABC transporter ATP-binding protein [Dehalococcoidales bacterium]
MTLLELDRVNKSFGGLLAVCGVTFKVHAGQIKALIGPNGAGKTTIFNLLSGIESVSSGSITFDGLEITRKPPHVIASLGLARTFQTVRLFGKMTVLQNVMVGRHCRSKSEVLATGLLLPSALREEREIGEKSMELLRFVGLGHRASDRAHDLPYGQQRLLELARSMATEPKLLLLDEPAAGLNDAETEVLSDLIYRIREQGITILLVEHDMGLVMDISDEVMVLDHGEKIAEGPPDVVSNDERVIEAYLGGGLKSAQAG